MKYSVAALLTLFCASLYSTHAQGNAFTYQGRLNSNGAPASGSYDLAFTLYSISAGGTALAGPVTNAATAVSNGLFTVTLDFGNQFPGADRWLELAVRTNGNGAFSTLVPRQQLTPTPYAVYAANAGSAVTAATAISAGSAGSVAAANITGALTTSQLPAGLITNGASGVSIAGTFTGEGSGLTSLNAATLSGLTSDGLWKITGNAGADPANGACLGTTDNLPVEFKANGQRALRLEYAFDPLYFSRATANITGGCPDNIISNGVSGGFIGGGGNSSRPNRIGGSYSSVVGGTGNTASGVWATAMGSNTRASGDNSTTMGDQTWASGRYSMAMGQGTFAGGNGSVAMGQGSQATNFAAVAAGYLANAGGIGSTAMGYQTTASGFASTALGYWSQANYDNTFVWSDGSSLSPFASSGTNQFCLRARGGVQLDPLTSQYFGAQSRQMLNLFGTNYGIGVQSDTLYFRCANSDANSGFIWYKGGGHNDNYVASGGAGGGTEMMHLIQGALYVNGTFVSSSDRNAKENFQGVDAQAVLAKVAALPLSRWNYKADKTQEHLGPMAQDFYAAFAVGPDDKHIATIDESGVALAAIQGLNQKLEQKETEIAALKARLEKLEQLLEQKLK